MVPSYNAALSGIWNYISQQRSKIFPDIPNSTLEHIPCVPMHNLCGPSFAESRKLWLLEWRFLRSSILPLPPPPMERVLSNYVGRVGHECWTNTIGWVELLNVFMPWNIGAERNLVNHFFQSPHAVTEEIKIQGTRGIFLKSPISLEAGHSLGALSPASWFCTLSPLCCF